MFDNTNKFKQSLRDGRHQIGLWAALGSAYTAEVIATAGFDWLLIDGEHAPNDIRSVLRQLQAVAPYPSHPIIRPVEADKALIKQYLDIGAQTFLVPMVDTAQEAAAVVSATRYPPQGVRGVGSSIARSSRWNGIPDYLQKANEEICVLVQVETATALKNLDEIVSTEGVDGVFFGPADLAASLGYLGQASASEVQRAIMDGIATVRRYGKAAGILTSDRSQARSYLDNGALFVAVGTDATLLAQSARALASEFAVNPQLATATKGDGTY